MATTAPVAQQSNSPLSLVKKNDLPVRPKQICRVSSKQLNDAAIQKAQEIWDTYFNKMMATFHEPNPDLNRDLALDRTIRALGQRPLTAQEQANLLRWCSSGFRSMGSCTHLPTRQEMKLQRSCHQEDHFEELCSLAFDA